MNRTIILFCKINQISLALVLLFLLGSVRLQAQNLKMNQRDLTDMSNAIWIGNNEKVIANDSLLYGDHPAPLFRKEFNITGKILKGTLTITAAGYYLIFINGQKVENNLLDPAWTNFSKRIYSAVYDISAQIRLGKNVVGTMLGNGFYNSLPLRMFGNFNLRQSLPTGQPRFIARLQIEYVNGSTEEIVTDGNWKTMEGPILRNNVYLGEMYDARKEVTGWEFSGYNDSLWKNADHFESPGGAIVPAFFPAVKVRRTIKPVQIRHSGPQIIVDFGVNLTGLYKIKMKGKPGDTIVFRFGERLYDNGTLNPMTTVAGQIKRKKSGGPGSPDIAWQTDSYIFGKTREVTWQPHFSFHTFRYAEISGLDYLPANDDMEAIEFHSGVENQNQFSCSSDLLNQIQIVCRQTFLNNLISVQSDCPAREKFGYGGDLNATSESFIYNFDMHSFYRKTIYDWEDAMRDSVFIDTAPFVGIKYCGISWESAFLTTQSKLFRYYGDTAIVNEFYKKDLDWMNKVATLHPEGIIDKGLSDHESLEKVPVQLIGTTHYLECARIMKRFAALKNDEPNVTKFSDLEKFLSRKLLDLYWHKPVDGPINRQTLFAALIYYRIIPENELPAVADSLLSAVRKAPAGHFTTGIFGTKYILEALSMTGHTDEVYRIVNSTEFPGWGYMINRGATTIWETWKESENTYSNCHPMFGTVSEWYFRWLAGIRPLENEPGFRKFLLAPSFPDGLNAVNAVYHAPTGDVKVKWQRDVMGKITLNVTVPTGSVAELLPVEKPRIHWKVTNVTTTKTIIADPGKASVILPEGVYLIN
ncbi:MAG: family 78 glycoside hydrolase catalytic domain [Prolixibacteraceae bacterium]